jgi:hypothetical protein
MSSTKCPFCLQPPDPGGTCECGRVGAGSVEPPPTAAELLEQAHVAERWAAAVNEIERPWWVHRSALLHSQAAALAEQGRWNP